MQVLLTRLRHALAPVAGNLRPRHLMWRVIAARRGNTPIITPLGLARNLKIRIYPSDVNGRNIYVHGFSEPAEERFVSSFLKFGMVFMDIGANNGQFTILAASLVGPSGTVHSFEPNNRMFAELSHNVRLNGFENRCCLNSVAVTDSSGVRCLSCYEPGAEVYCSLVEQTWTGRSTVAQQPVQTVSLDEYVTTHHIDCVDLMKVDVEGGELQVLRGAESMLSREPGPTVLVEMADATTAAFGYSAVDTWDFLVAHGYHMYTLCNKGRELRPALRPPDFSPALNIVASKRNLD